MSKNSRTAVDRATSAPPEEGSVRWPLAAGVLTLIAVLAVSGDWQISASAALNAGGLAWVFSR